MTIHDLIADLVESLNTSRPEARVDITVTDAEGKQFDAEMTMMTIHDLIADLVESLDTSRPKARVDITVTDAEGKQFDAEITSLEKWARGVSLMAWAKS